MHNQLSVVDVFSVPEPCYRYFPTLDLGSESHPLSGSASNRIDCSCNYHLRPPTEDPGVIRLNTFRAVTFYCIDARAGECNLCYSDRRRTATRHAIGIAQIPSQ